MLLEPSDLPSPTGVNLSKLETTSSESRMDSASRRLKLE